MRSLSLELGHSALHLLDCKILLVEQLLLSLSFDLKLVDISLQVSRGREGTRDVANEVGLLSTKFEKLLRFFEKSLFLWANFLFNFSLHVLWFLVLSFRCLICGLKPVLGSNFLAKAILSGLIFLFRSFKPLHSFTKHLVDICYIRSLVLKLSGKGRELVPLDGNSAFSILGLLVSFL